MSFTKAAGGMAVVAEWIVKGFMYVFAFIVDGIKIVKIAWKGYMFAVLTVWGAIIQGVGVAVSAIVNIWGKGMGLMQMAAAAMMRGFAKGMGIVGDLLIDAGFTKAGIYVGIGASIADTKAGSVMAKGLDKLLATHKSEFGEYLQQFGKGMQDEGQDHAARIFELWDEGWAMGKVGDQFKNMIESALGPDKISYIPDPVQITPQTPAGMGGGKTTSLQTAIGSMKVGLDSQQHTNKQLLKEAKKENTTSKRILAAIKEQGTAVLI